MDDLHRMPGHLIRRAQQVSTALFAEECAGFDMTSVQYAALSAIGASPGVDATRLSHLIAFDRSTLGDVIERLEAKGWVQRDSSARDRRIKTLTLTEAGGQVLQEVEPAVMRVQERLLAPLGVVDRVTFMKLLSRIAEVHNEVTSAPLRVVGQR